MEFHISRRARQKYNFDLSLFSTNGNVIFANFHAGRVFAQRMNEARDVTNHPERTVRAGQVNAMGLMDEILHYMLSLYRTQKVDHLQPKMLTYVEKWIGKRALNRALTLFTAEFPPLVVHQGQQTVDEYLKGSSEGVSHRAIALEEMALLGFANQNPAFGQFSELYDDGELKKLSNYSKIIDRLNSFFKNQPTFGPDNQSLMDMLRSPFIAAPHSLEGQLEYMRDRWGYMLSHYLMKLLGSLDMISEEYKLRGLGPGEVLIPLYDKSEWDAECFSPDSEWMPHLVLLAKNAHVWLGQLSLQFNLPIHRLDQIPDETLDQLAEWGFTGLWLIGLWERSPASARIKQLCGNTEAIASAYSLADYKIAEDLGGEKAYENLRQRAWQRGIRLASDMVPNHMGIDSHWVHDHPDWFLSLDHPPFPAYAFNGPDLSSDTRGSIQLEDHYYTRTDAAVVFKYHRKNKNKDYYIYHGNDGTSMPWNDTAQLNYLKPEVREAVIQTILSVARQFPILRFDAAMTLTRRHYQRLWFPEPGTGSAIPSRVDFGMTREQFNKIMPREFWREVVERVSQEVPGTLLLAEAFWLMEGYFVRSLGMHRVYNSAFMNLLRDEENAKYRQVMKNTLEFDPQILERFVNFMNNPDERTALDQFGKGDKYFGICMLMSTMPGLPMFGHGQIEGFAEKYGMEFKHAYWNELPDVGLVTHHQRIIFPLLKKRYLFSGVENFRLYDFYTRSGRVDENVFAYSNQVGGERALVVYHNRSGETYGWVRTSAAYFDKANGVLHQLTLGEGLGIGAEPDVYLTFRDQLSGLEYIRDCGDVCEKGLYLELGAYQAHVFVDFRMVQDDRQHTWKHLCQTLNDSGTPSLSQMQVELPLQPVLRPWREIANPGYFGWLLQNRTAVCGRSIPEHLLNEAEYKLTQLAMGINEQQGITLPQAELAYLLTRRFMAVFCTPVVDQGLSAQDQQACKPLMRFILSGYDDDRWLALFSWLFTCVLVEADKDVLSADLLFTQWRFTNVLEQCLTQMGRSQWAVSHLPNTVRMLFTLQGWYERQAKTGLQEEVTRWLADAAIRQFLEIHLEEDMLVFQTYAFDDLLIWLMILAVMDALEKIGGEKIKLAENLLAAYVINERLKKAKEDSGFQVEKLLELLK